MRTRTCRMVACSRAALLSWTALLAGLVLLGGLLLEGRALARGGPDLKRVLSMSDRQKARLPKKVLCQAVRQYGLKAVALRRSFVKRHSDSYKVTIPTPRNHRVRDQQGSGDCWIFATGRVLSSKLYQRGRPAPNLSASFINYHSLKQIAFELLDQAARSGKHRVDLKSVTEAGEGGFQIWAMEIIRRRGFVPESRMHMTADAASPGVYINRLQTLLVKAEQDLARAGQGRTAGKKRKALAGSYKKQVEKLLDTALGKPPKKFSYRGKSYTPRTFARQYLELGDRDLDYVTLTHYTDRAMNRRYLGGEAPGMKPFDEYNVSMKVIQQTIKKTLRRGEAVLFGINADDDNLHHANSEHFPEEAKGILSSRAFSYERLVPSPRISKRAKLKAGLGEANHAMAITGYDPGKKRGTVLKWKVENSHGKETGDKGYFHMYDDFFRRNVEDVVVPRSVVPARMLSKMDSSPRIKTPESPRGPGFSGFARIHR